MYYADLEKYSYDWSDPKKKFPDGLAIGWLDKEHQFNRGDVPNDFLDSLWKFCYDPPLLFLGFHECPFCENPPPFGILVNRNGQEIRLGSGDIWVFGEKGLFYVAPDLIYHYVIAHHYCPPEEFIQAVLLGPQPGTEEYKNYTKSVRLTD